MAYTPPPEDDDLLLNAEPVSVKRMHILWLDRPRLQQVASLVHKHGTIDLTLSETTTGELDEYEITKDDVEWAESFAEISDRADDAGKKDKYHEAVVLYREALALAPGCDLFLMSIGICYVELGQRARGLRFLDRAAQISPTNQRIRGNLEAAKGS